MNSELIDRNELDVPSDENYYEELVQFADDVMNMPTVPAIIIPKNATNGDMIKAMFPNAKINEIKGTFDKKTLLGYRTWLGGRSQDFLSDWWNEPYKKEVEE